MTKLLVPDSPELEWVHHFICGLNSYRWSPFVPFCHQEWGPTMTRLPGYSIIPVLRRINKLHLIIERMLVRTSWIGSNKKSNTSDERKTWSYLCRVYLKITRLHNKGSGHHSKQQNLHCSLYTHLPCIILLCNYPLTIRVGPRIFVISLFVIVCLLLLCVLLV